MKSDLEIAQAATLLSCEQLAQRLNLAQEDWEPYGRYKAKVDPRLPRRGGQDHHQHRTCGRFKQT